MIEPRTRARSGSIRGARAASTSNGAALAAQAALDAGGTAVDAAMAGFFAAAGENGSALFAPAVLLLAGTGAGARVLDGRAVQPGRGGAKARAPGSAAPLAARAAAPRAVAMMVLAHSQRGRLTLSEVSRAGAAAAEGAAGNKARADLLRALGRKGVTALAADAVIEALLEAAGPGAGGSLTRADVTEATPEDAAAVERSFDGGNRVVLVPADYTRVGDSPPEGGLISLVAVDARGLAAALAIDLGSAFVDVPSLGIALPACADVARKGVPRVAPGTPIASRAHVAIAQGSALTLALAASSSVTDIDFQDVFSGRPIEAIVADIARATGSEQIVAVARTGNDARVVA